MKPTQAVQKKPQPFETKVSTRQNGCNLFQGDPSGKIVARAFSLNVSWISFRLHQKEAAMSKLFRENTSAKWLHEYTQLFTCNGKHHTLLSGPQNSENATRRNPVLRNPSTKMHRQALQRCKSFSLPTFQTLSTANIDVCHFAPVLGPREFRF